MLLSDSATNQKYAEMAEKIWAQSHTASVGNSAECGSLDNALCVEQNEKWREKAENISKQE